MERTFGLEQQIYQGLLNRGFRPAAAAGLTGNAFAESSYNPAAFNPAGGGQGALGLFQWRGDRQRNFKNYAAQQGIGTDTIDSNLDFLVHELNNYPEHAMITMDELNAIDDPVEVGRVFRERFERPGADPGGFSRAQRRAGQVYNQYSGLEPVEGYKSQEPNLKFDDSLTRGKPLMGFADDADKRSRHLQSLALTQGKEFDAETRLFMESMIPGNYTNTLHKAAGADATGAPPQAAGAGGTAAGLPYHTGSPVAGGEAPAAVSTSNPEAAPDEKPSLMERIFPRRATDNAPDTPFYNRGSFVDAITSLGINMSRLSHGQPVGSMPTILAMQQGREARLQATADARQQAFDNYISEMNANTSLMNAELSQRKHEHDLAKFDHEVEKYNAGTDPIRAITPEKIAPLLAENPALGPLYTEYLTGNEEAAKQLYEYLGQGQTESPKPIGDLARQVGALAAGGAPRTTWAPALASLEPHEVEFISKLMPSTPPSSIQEAEWVSDLQSRVAANPDDIAAQRQLEAYNRAQLAHGGIDPNKRQVDDQKIKEYQEAQDRAYAIDEQATETEGLVADTMASTIAINQSGGETGAVTPLIRAGQSFLESIGAKQMSDALGRELGIPAGTLEQLTTDGLAFMYALKEQKGMTGSSFSDKDADMLKSISASELNSSEGRVRLLSRMSANAAMDHAKADYITSSDTQYENIRERQRYANLDMERATNALQKAAQNDALESLTGGDYGENASYRAKMLNRLEELRAISKDANANGRDANSEVAAKMKEWGVTNSQMESFLRSRYVEMPLEIAEKLQRHASYLKFIRTPDGKFYNRQKDGSWKLAPQTK